ncbi:hypothetical protein EDD85DRAFT_798999 [Armillaria nabsnona]|nr:hypothetical protein EDD85DRAFT_798999 [Armillaria nabsnona]
MAARVTGAFTMDAQESWDSRKCLVLGNRAMEVAEVEETIMDDHVDNQTYALELASMDRCPLARSGNSKGEGHQHGWMGQRVGGKKEELQPVIEGPDLLLRLMARLSANSAWRFGDVARAMDVLFLWSQEGGRSEDGKSGMRDRVDAAGGLVAARSSREFVCGGTTDGHDGGMIAKERF